MTRGPRKSKQTPHPEVHGVRGYRFHALTLTQGRWRLFISSPPFEFFIDCDYSATRFCAEQPEPQLFRYLISFKPASAELFPKGAAMCLRYMYGDALGRPCYNCGAYEAQHTAGARCQRYV